MKNRELPDELIPDTAVALGTVGPPLPGDSRLTAADIEIRETENGFEAVIKPEALRRTIRRGET